MKALVTLSDSIQTCDANSAMEYMGYEILAIPCSGKDGMWCIGYQISKDRRMVSLRCTANSGFSTFTEAALKSIERARLEIDKRVGASD
jgi:hypothetical protein